MESKGPWKKNLGAVRFDSRNPDGVGSSIADRHCIAEAHLANFSLTEPVKRSRSDEDGWRATAAGADDR
jgi:hypothetical protein